MFLLNAPDVAAKDYLVITLPFKSLVSVRFFKWSCFLNRHLYSQSSYLFDKKKYSKNSNIVKYYDNLKKVFSILIYFKV